MNRRVMWIEWNNHNPLLALLIVCIALAFSLARCICINAAASRVVCAASPASERRDANERTAVRECVAVVYLVRCVVLCASMRVVPLAVACRVLLCTAAVR